MVEHINYIETDGTVEGEGMPKYLFDHPEKFESTLDIVGSLEYR